MLTITTAAWKRLLKLQSKRPDVTTMRLTHVDGKVKCHRGVQKKGDLIIENAGHPKLLIKPALAAQLSNNTLDAPKTESGRRLRLSR